MWWWCLIPIGVIGGLVGLVVWAIDKGSKIETGD